MGTGTILICTVLPNLDLPQAELVLVLNMVVNLLRFSEPRTPIINIEYIDEYTRLTSGSSYLVRLQG